MITSFLAPELCLRIILQSRGGPLLVVQVKPERLISVRRQAPVPAPPPL